MGAVVDGARPDPKEPAMDVVGEVLAQRTCGRCRQLFDGDPTLHPGAIAEWWACDACRRKLGLAPASDG